MLSSARRSIFAAAMPLLASCAAHPAHPPLLTEPSAIDTHEGQQVTLRGPLQSIKWPTLLGVCVAVGADGPPHGTLVEATGTLRRRFAPAPDSVWDSLSKPYGHYFVLEAPSQPNRLAAVRSLREDAIR